MTFVSRAGSSEEVCSSYKLRLVFVIVKIMKSLFPYASPLPKVSDFISTII